MNTTPKKKLRVGDTAPQFVAHTQDGQPFALSQQINQTVVLYFYPKDDTPGCTQEGKDFTALLPQFAQSNAVVVGVSADSVASHAKFCQKYNFTVTLLADESRDALIEPYGVWIEKTMYGKKFMGIDRATFVIDSAKVIRHIWNNVRVAGHADAVLKAVQAIAAEAAPAA